MESLIKIAELANQYADLGLLVLAIISAVIAFGQWRDQRKENELRTASGLTAWWAKRTDYDDERWGVVISNTSKLTFYDVIIESKGNFNKSARPIEIKAIPPGHFFIKAMYESDRFDWGWAEEIKDFYNSPFQPILNSNGYKILSMLFSDYFSRKWKWTPEVGIIRL